MGISSRSNNSVMRDGRGQTNSLRVEKAQCRMAFGRVFPFCSIESQITKSSYAPIRT